MSFTNIGNALHDSIFEQELKTVKVAGMDLPVKFGISALEEVQDKYGTLLEYEQKLKMIPTKDEATKAIVKNLTGGSRKSSPVTDGILAMIHCGCRAKMYDLTGVTDDEILIGIEEPFFSLRNLVIEEFNRNFIETGDEKPKKQSRAKKLSR